MCARVGVCDRVGVVRARSRARGADLKPPRPFHPPVRARSRVPFFAAGISSVMHPKNPHAPTMHFNYR
jgi:coproporphyrinogen III oxidase